MKLLQNQGLSETANNVDPPAKGLAGRVASFYPRRREIQMEIHGPELIRRIDFTRFIVAALATKTVNIKMIAASEIKISVLIDRKYMELAVQALHDAFDLDKA